MAQTTDERIDKLEDHLRAVKVLLLSHLAAANGADGLLIDATLNIAERQVQGGRDQGSNRVALFLEDMISAIADLKKP